MIGLTVATAVAQEQQEMSPISKKRYLEISDTINPKLKEKNYNRWSLSLNGGVNTPAGPFTEGYYSANTNYLKNPNFNHLDLNIRKMFNTKFGLMWVLAYDKFSSAAASIPFSNKMFSTSLQGVF